jgi:SAM-dependent methyltransferase
MARALDILTSATLKHLRDRWWDEAFTAFLQENLQARAGNRILDVGCGTGTAELYLSRLRLSQVSLFGVDLVFERVRQAKEEAAAHNYRARYAAADAVALPFAAGVFDSTFCVAVLQHVRDLDRALSEFARVTRPGGRILAVEPDNRSRYWFSSVEGGMRAFELGSRFVAEIALARGDATDAVGPRLPALFVRHGIEPLAVHVFPVTVSHLGAPPESVWAARREAVEREIERVNDQAIRRLGRDFLKLLERYAEEARAAGASFVEIQNTLLFATVGQRRDA